MNVQQTLRDIAQECKFVAITVGKAENTFIAAGMKFAEVVDYVMSPGTDGAQQVIDAGYEPTKTGIFSMIRGMPEWPQQIGSSERTRQRLLAYAKDPSKQEQDNEKKRVTKPATGVAFCNKEIPVILGAIHQLTTQELKEFLYALADQVKPLGISMSFTIM